MQTAAFFDIDGTLYREGFIADLFKMLIKCEVIEYNEWQDKVRPAFENWDRRLGNYDKYLMQMAAGYTEALKGHHKSLMDHIVTRIIKDKAMRTYVYTRNRIQWHKEKGHLVFTISGSPRSWSRPWLNSTSWMVMWVPNISWMRTSIIPERSSPCGIPKPKKGRF